MSGADMSADAAVERIRADREHGASWLAREAARLLGEAALAAGEADARLEATHALARQLAQARPSMAAIANTVAHVWWAASSQAGQAESRLVALRDEARAVAARWDTALGGMTAWAREAVCGPVYTLSRSGSVEGTLNVLARERANDDPLRVIVSESRPGGEGVGLARALAEAGAQVTLAADGACATLIADAALVIVGADSVRSDGSVVNKVGTHTLALVARQAGKPFYVLAERLKVTPRSYPLVIEEMEPGELLPQPVVGVTARNIYFDVTPAALITGVVMDSGLVDSDALTRVANDAERAYVAFMRQ